MRKQVNGLLELVEVVYRLWWYKGRFASLLMRWSSIQMRTSAVEDVVGLEHAVINSLVLSNRKDQFDPIDDHNQNDYKPENRPKTLYSPKLDAPVSLREATKLRHWRVKPQLLVVNFAQNC